jgi:excisionase family DNA binding protein
MYGSQARTPGLPCEIRGNTRKVQETRASSLLGFFCARAPNRKDRMSRGFPSRPVSVREAAALTGVSRDTIRRRIADGTLTGYKLGKQIVRIDLDELEELFVTTPARSDVP